jgi:hypothetical protein
MRPVASGSASTFRVSTTVGSVAAGALVWLLPRDGDAVATIFQVSGTAACACGLLAAWVFPGSPAALMALAGEFGILLALAIPSLFSIGVLFLGAAALIAIAGIASAATVRQDRVIACSFGVVIAAFTAVAMAIVVVI